MWITGRFRDEEVDLVFWVADTGRMEVRPLKQSFRIKRKDLQAGSWLRKSK
jgi:hypothetical protein